MTRPRSALTRLFAVVVLAAAVATSACSSATDAPPAATADGSTETAATTGGATLSHDADGVVTGISYPGQNGRTALELLLEHDPQAQVEGEGETAFVTGIGGRVADSAANEFWSLDVDGEFAMVGAGSLVTEDGETITWTLDTF